MLLYFYLTITFVFLISYLLRIESYQFDLSVTRSRETKALMKRKLDKDIQDIRLVLIWPWLVCRHTYELVRAIKDSRL